jgi:signal transduction histidine kinase
MSTHLLLEERVGPLTPKQLDLLITAREDAERLNNIIENLLDIGRIESGRVLMELKPLNAEQLVNDAIEPFATAYRDRGVTLQCEVEPELPDVLADPTRIGHVFSNLLDNALKYTASGGKVVLSAKNGNRAVIFTVEDTGTGMAEEALFHVFEKFYRSPDQPPDVKGAGLGLAIAREIVEAHGGEIKAQSQPAKGTKMTFTLKGVSHE